MDAKRNTSGMKRKTYTQNIQWNKIAHAYDQDGQVRK